MPVVRILLSAIVAASAIVAGVVAGAGIGGAEMAPAVDSAAERAWTSPPCAVAVTHDVAFDPGLGAYAVRAVHVSAPGCGAVDVRVVLDGTTVEGRLVDGLAELELPHPLPAEQTTRLQVSTAS